jgi:demethylmenaquinone methyltransferase/2-methoxy-6-polyprenyl-1,4-benzoquinol methylase
MPISKENVEAAYQRHARSYDLATKFFYPLIGLHIDKYRRRAVEHLNLQPSDTVVEVGCGTGLNFTLLMDRIGPNGHLIGIDISSEMLSLANKKIKYAGWTNVLLIHSDIAKYEFPSGINGAICTGVFGYIEERREVIERISKALAYDGRLVIVDGRRPVSWPTWAFKMFVRLSRSFGVTEDYFNANTWKIVEELFEDTTFEEMYAGAVYISSGRKEKRKLLPSNKNDLV